MAFDTAKIQQALAQVGGVTNTLVQLLISLTVLLFVSDILFGTSIGVAQRLAELTALPVKNLLAWIIGSWFVYKAVIR